MTNQNCCQSVEQCGNTIKATLLACTTIIGGLFTCLVYFLPLENWLVTAVLWWNFAAAHGSARNEDCDLPIDRYFWYATFMFLLQSVGTFLGPSQKIVPLHYYEEDKTCAKIVAWSLVLPEIFFGMMATVWIPEEVTCPETAPGYFSAAKWMVYGWWSFFTLRVLIGVLLALFGYKQVSNLDRT